MNATTHTTPVAETSPITAALETAAAETMLRDVAYVLRLTRRVKDQMVADPRTNRLPTERRPEGVLVA